MSTLTRTLALALILCFSAQTIFGGAAGDASRAHRDVRHGVALSLRVLGGLISGPLQIANISGVDIRVTTPGDKVLARFHYANGARLTWDPVGRRVFRMTGEGKFLTIESPFLRVTVLRSGRDSR